MYESNRECSEMVFHTSLFKMIWSLLISDQLCCIANRQMTDFLSLCPYPLLSIWTSLNWDPCPWVWLCVCVCVCVCVVCVCVVTSVVACKNPNISHATFMTLKQGIMGLPGLWPAHTHTALSCFYWVLCEWLLMYLSISWKEETSCVRNRWKTFIHVPQKCHRGSHPYKTSNVCITRPNTDPQLGPFFVCLLKCTTVNMVSAKNTMVTWLFLSQD